LKTITLTGKVFSGKGNGRKFLSLKWVKEQIKQKLGFNPYLGTLNILLSEESTKRRKILEKPQSMMICPAQGYCLGILHGARIEEFECAVIIPDVTGYPENYLELIAAENMRQKLQLKDGDDIRIVVSYG
jgi:riboflavin kinase, archaea type